MSGTLDVVVGARVVVVVVVLVVLIVADEVVEAAVEREVLVGADAVEQPSTMKRMAARRRIQAGYVPPVLKQRLVDRIEREGPIPFEEFMQAALYDPDLGFFASGDLRSRAEGDFLTSPEVSPMFGASLARFVQEERERLGDSEGFTVVDVGAGSGSLLEGLVEALPVPARFLALELSPAARAQIVDRLPEAELVSYVPDGMTGVVFANELLDNFPVALAVRTDGWQERWVGADRGELAWVAVSARPQVAEWAERFGGEATQVEVQLAAGAWLRSTLRRLRRGAVVVVDYGDSAEGLARRRPQGTLRTYRAHHLGPDPLSEPGETDITVDVNFTALEAVAQEEGWTTELMRQADFLAGLGLERDLEALRSRELELARAGESLERLKVRSRITDAEALLHPRGLGDFRVLVVTR